MHYDISYKGIEDRYERDAKAIRDIENYLNSPEKFQILLDLASEVDNGHTPIKGLNIAFGFAGIQGYPFHAFCRKFCLKPYIEWMTSGADAVQVDREGFTITDKS